MKIKELIALLQKENPEARVVKYNDGGTTLTLACPDRVVRLGC